MPVKDIEDQEPNAFQKRVSDLFYDLFYDQDQLLSLSWTRRLLQSFLLCQQDFLAAVRSHRSAASSPSTERLTAEFCDRSVKALDACNAAVNGIERLRRRRHLAEIVHVALSGQRKQLQRAKRALSELADERELREETKPVLTWHRHSRSHSWGGAATKQPLVDGSGMAAALGLMNWLLAFVVWALAALAGHHVSFHVASPKGLPWAALLQERMAAEVKKRRGSGGGLLSEAQRITTCALRLAELADLGPCHLAEREDEMAELVAELAQVNESTKDELEPLEQLVRRIFHGIVRTREETLI